MAKSSPLMARAKQVRDFTSIPSLARFEREFLAGYRPHAKQRAFAKAWRVRNRVIVAGRRSGKTYSGGREFAKGIYRDAEALREAGATWVTPTRLTKDTKPLLLYWCVAPTYAMGFYQRQEFFEAIGGTDSDLILKYEPSKNQVWLKGGLLVEFKSADNPLKLAGSGLSGMWLDEAARIKESTWSENLEPTLKDKQGWCIVTTTPLGKNWVYQDMWRFCQDPKETEWFGLNFTTADNTSLPHLAQEMENARRQLSRPVFLRNYMASFDAFEGKIFEDFLDDSTHIISSLPRLTFVQSFGGLDWGHRNPGCLLSLGADSQGRAYVWSEDYERGLSLSPPPNNPFADSWVDRIRQKDLEAVWADPSLPGNIMTCQQHGLEVYAAENSVLPGIDFLGTMLKPVEQPQGPKVPSLFIHESCVNLRRELTSYAYGDDDKPVKQDDHSCFPAGTMVSTSTGPQPIESIQPGDLVWTRAGLRPVKESGMTHSNAPVMTVKTADGKTLTGTPNHPVFVEEKGWTRMDALRYGDLLVSLNNEEVNSWQIQKRLCSMASNSGVIPTPKTQATGITIDPLQITCEMASKRSTGRFTKMLTGTSRLAGMCITSMETPSTTTPQTSKHCPLLNTSVNTPATSQKSGVRRCGAILSEFALSPWRGMRAKKGACGMLSMPRRHGRAELHLSRYATVVKELTRRLFLLAPGFAPTLASPLGEERKSLTIKSRNVCNVARPLWSADTARPSVVHAPVVHVGEIEGTKPVYNLSVHEHHEYFVESLLVHNCDALRYAMYTEMMKGTALQPKIQQLRRDFPSLYQHAA